MADLEMLIVIKDGKVRVEGPIDDKVAAYGMLEAARDAIKDYHDAQRRPPPTLINMPSEPLVLGHKPICTEG